MCIYVCGGWFDVWMKGWMCRYVGFGCVDISVGGWWLRGFVDGFVGMWFVVGWMCP